MSGEPDSGTGPESSSVILLDPSINNNNNEDEHCDIDKKPEVSSNSKNHDLNYELSSSVLKCDRCESFETISRALLQVHVEQCSSKNNHRFEKIDVSTDINVQCNEGMGTGDQQTTDIKQPHYRKLFECDVCNMKFSNGANMRRHKMRHTGVKPYECRVCQKRFFRKDHLAEHFTTHTKTLPYHCPICNRGFQRQIAMRAHFQNEHVGQHELVKTCPLCSYRAGTMKSLRVHFFNRHGIDLDNPGPNATSSLLLALDPTNSANYLPSLAVTVTAAGGNCSSESGPVGVHQLNFSDSGDSMRSADNGTPPMHFLTPHVEISMADDSFKIEPGQLNVNSGLDKESYPSSRPNGCALLSPHSADSNSNAPSSSQSLIGCVLESSKQLLVDGYIKPSISLIPIKQEPSSDEYNEVIKLQRQIIGQQSPRNTHETLPNLNNIPNPTQISTTSSSPLASLIKVSPLKSLLREDLKRRISARACSRITRSHNLSNSISVTTESSPTPPPVSSQTLSSIVVATTSSNATITSTGPEMEILVNARKRMLQCLFCCIEFPDQTLYFLHKGCHSESNPWKCNICGEQLNNVYEFNSHLLSKSHQ